MAREINLAPVLAHNAADDQQAESSAACFCREIWLEDFAHVFLGDPAAAVGKCDRNEMILEIGANPQQAAASSSPGTHF